MKKVRFVFVALMGMMAASCGSDKFESDREAEQVLAPVRVRVSGFSVDQEEFSGGTTRATQAAADYSGVKVLTLAFYSGSTEPYKVTQMKSSLEEGETFGVFNLSLPMGSYTMVVLGYGLNAGEPAVTLTSPTVATFGEYPARETFVATEAVNITDASAVDVSAMLSRIVSKLHVESTDVRTAGAAKVRMTFAAGSKGFNPTEGLATDDTGFSNTVTISTAAGVISESNSYLFLNSDDQTMDVTIETLDADDNVLLSKTVENVPFKRNRVTIMKGAMYTNESTGGTFTVETDWLSSANVDF